MSTTSAPLTDSRVMLRRNLKHILRNPVTIFNGALMPVVIMLMFVYVLGNAFNVGEHYIEYATPGLILLAISYGLSATAVSVNSDMTKGIINRFKVMNAGQFDSRCGHHRNGLRAGVPVVCDPPRLARRDRHHRGNSLRGCLAHRRAGNSGENAGIRRPHRRAADPAALREQRDRAGRQDGTGGPAIAEYQPFTPIIESVRGLLAGTPSGGYAAAALAWCAGIALVGYLWALATFRRRA